MSGPVSRTSQLFRAAAEDRTPASIEKEDGTRANSSLSPVQQDTSLQQQLQRERHDPLSPISVTDSPRLSSPRTPTNVLSRDTWRNDLQDLLVQNGGAVTPPATPQATSRGLHTRAISRRQNTIPIAEDNTAQAMATTPVDEFFQDQDNVSYRAQRGPLVPLLLPTPESSEAKRKRTPPEEAIFERKLRKTGHIPGSGTFMVPESSDDEEECSELESLQEELYDTRASQQLLAQENKRLMEQVEALETKVGELQDGLRKMDGLVQKLIAMEDVDQREDERAAEDDVGEEVDENYWPDQMGEDDEDGQGLEGLNPRPEQDLAQEVQDLLAVHRAIFPKWSLLGSDQEIYSSRAPAPSIF